MNGNKVDSKKEGRFEEYGTRHALVGGACVFRGKPRATVQQIVGPLKEQVGQQLVFFFFPVRPLVLPALPCSVPMRAYSGSIAWIVYIGVNAA